MTYNLTYQSKLVPLLNVKYVGNQTDKLQSYHVSLHHLYGQTMSITCYRCRITSSI